MTLQYEPQKHIQRLDVAPRAEGIFDQREITIQSYQTTLPFDLEALDAGLSAAWLTPQIRLGVFSRISKSDNALNVVLGLQDSLTIRAYDYDERRPIWYSWQDAIVETVNLHYARDEHGLLQFTTTGGGRRITDDRLNEFNSVFLKIPAVAVTKRQFDLDKLRSLCFNRFADRLYMVRFADPSAKEYRSIDHALFQSRQYIDPNAERLKEISTDNKVKIESFDSDIDIHTNDLAAEIHVRFFIRGLSGSLRLRFPKILFKKQLKTVEEQALVFYRLADNTVRAILDDDYYANQRRTLDDLHTDDGMFADMVDIAPYREVLTSAEERRKWFLSIDLSDHWSKWKPHLDAIDELLQSDVVLTDVKDIVGQLIKRDPNMTVRLLAVCQDDPHKQRIGAVVANTVAAELQFFPTADRARVEEIILSWAIACEQDSWEVDPDMGDFGAFNIKWRIDDISFDALPAVIWKIIGVIHHRLVASTDDIGPLLRKFNWCCNVAKSFPVHHSRNSAALRLIAAQSSEVCSRRK